METTKKEKPTKHNGKLSLYPLKFEQAVKGILATTKLDKPKQIGATKPHAYDNVA